MYVTLLLLAPALAEWVEISQLHYTRKPQRNHYLQTATEHYPEQTISDSTKQFQKPHIGYDSLSDVTENYEEETTSHLRKPTRTQYFPADGVTEVYMEDGLSGLSRYGHRESIRHYFHTTDPVTEDYIEETTSYYRKSTNAHFSAQKVDEGRQDFKMRNRIYLNQSIFGTNTWNKGNINKVPKHGSIQRVQLETNAVKAPILGRNSVKNSIIMRDYNNSTVKYVNEVSEIVGTTEENLRDIYIERKQSNMNRINSGLDEDLKKVAISGPGIAEIRKKVIKNAPKDNTTFGIRFGPKNPNSLFITRKEHQDIAESNIYILDNLERDLNTPFINLSKIKDAEEQVFPMHTKDANTFTRTGIERKGSQNDQEGSTKKKPSLGFINTESQKYSEDDFATVTDENDEVKVTTSHETNKNPNTRVNLDSGGEEYTSKEPSNDSKANTMENLIVLMKVVADTIRKNTRQNVNSKTKYLTNLKETILRSIKERIDATWPDDPPAGQRSRATRAAQAQARGHLEIPSAESALMTISFLTFAVFLIKLVLQIIQVYKNKTMMVTPAVVATVGRAAAATKHSNSKP